MGAMVLKRSHILWQGTTITQPQCISSNEIRVQCIGAMVPMDWEKLGISLVNDGLDLKLVSTELAYAYFDGAQLHKCLCKV